MIVSDPSRDCDRPPGKASFLALVWHFDGRNGCIGRHDASGASRNKTHVIIKNMSERVR
jgi:hypothetical protein